MLQSHEVMRGILLIFGLVTFMGVNGQTTLFSDNFNRTAASMGGANLDNGWIVDTVVAGDGGHSWQIAPDAGCENGDLRFSSNGACNYTPGTDVKTHVVYQIVDASAGANGYENLRISFTYLADNDNDPEGDAFTPGFADYEFARLVYKLPADGAWTEIESYDENSSGTATNVPIGGGDDEIVWIGFQIEVDDDGSIEDLFNTDDLGNTTNRFVVDNVVIEGFEIVAPGLVEGTYYLDGDGVDPNTIGNWYNLTGNAVTYATDPLQFQNSNNTFVIADGDFTQTLGIWASNPTAGTYALTADLTVAHLVVFNGSTLSNDGSDLNITSDISIEANAVYNHNSIDQGGAEKTEDFPFDKMLNSELVGKVVLTNSGGAGFENVWSLSGDLDWTTSGVVENNGDLFIEGSGTLSVNTLQSIDPNSTTTINNAGAYLSISNSVSLPTNIVEHFQIDSDPSSSGFIIQDGATFSGAVHIHDNMGISSMNRIILEDNATAYWHSGDGLNFTGGITVEEVNNDANASFQLVENLELGAGDTLDVQVGVSLQADEVITLSSGSHLTMNKGTIDSVSIGAGACFSVSTPTASALGHGGILVQANGVFYVEDGASLIQNSGNIVVAGGPTPFTQGGDFVDLDATGSAWGGAPSVSISNNIGWTDWSHYTYWSCPITNIPISIPSAVSIYEYTDNEDELGTGWVGPQSANFEAGRGYAVQQAGGGLVTFEGTCNTGNINGPEIGDDQGAVADGNWSLIGNPYPSAINGFLLVDAHPEILGALYIWDQSDFDSEFSFATNDYSVVNGTGVASGGRGLNDTTTIQGYYIPPFQAFFVTGVEQPVLASNTPVVFTNSMRDTTLVDTEHNHSFKSNSKQRLWIELFEYDQEEAEITECLIGFLPEATNGFDRMYDATNNNDGLNISSVIEVLDSVGNVRDKMSLVIQGRGELVIGDIVDLELEILHPGPYQLDIRKLENFDNQEIWIRDELLGVSHLLSQEPYIFQVNEAGLYDLQLMFHEPGTIGIEEEMVEAIPLDLKRKSGKWESNLDGEVVITTMAGQLLNQFDVKAKQPFAIEEDKGFFHFKSNDGQFKRWMLK